MCQVMGFQRIAQRCVAAALVILFGELAPVGATEFDRGRTLYEHHCKYCHENWAHIREGRVVASLDDLRARVASWSVHSGLQWRNEEIDDVTAYLNRRFYQLTR